MARSVDLDIGMRGALYLVALTNFVAALPAAPGSIGTFDAAVAWGVKRLGASGSAAVSYLIMLRFILYVPITVVGFVVLVTRYGGWARLREALRTEREVIEASPSTARRPRPRPAAQPQPSGPRRPPLAPARCGCPPHSSDSCARGRSRPRQAGRVARRRPARSRRAARLATARRWRCDLAGCLAVSALTLLFPSTPTYDPWAWILWGREITHLDLVTEGGPSWKPLPILFTTPFSLFGDDLAPYLWLWVARAGGLFGCVMAFRIARRLVGGRHLRGARRRLRRAGAVREQQVRARRRARQLGAAARRASPVGVRAPPRRPPRPRALPRRRGRAAAARGVAVPRRSTASGCGSPSRACGCGWSCFAVLIPALWFLPEWWGSGDPFRAGARANAPNPGSPPSPSTRPSSCFKRFAEARSRPVEAGTLVATACAVVAWCADGRRAAILALAAIGFAWFALVAA